MLFHLVFIPRCVATLHVSNTTPTSLKSFAFAFWLGCSNLHFRVFHVIYLLVSQVVHMSSSFCSVVGSQACTLTSSANMLMSHLRSVLFWVALSMVDVIFSARVSMYTITMVGLRGEHCVTSLFISDVVPLWSPLVYTFTKCNVSWTVGSSFLLILFYSVLMSPSLGPRSYTDFRFKIAVYHTVAQFVMCLIIALSVPVPS